MWPSPSTATRAAPSVNGAADHHDDHTQDRRTDRDERRRPAVAERVVRAARAAGTAPYGHSPRASDAARRRAARRRSCVASPNATTLHHRQRERDHHRRHRQHEHRHRRRAPTAATRAKPSRPFGASARESGRIAVRIGCARTAYGARKNTNATWYATSRPSTLLPRMIAAPQQQADHRCWNTRPAREAQQRGCTRRRRGDRGGGADGTPVRRSADARTATNATTPSVPPSARSSCSPVVRSSPGSGPATQPEDHQRGDDHDGVADRRERGDRRAAAWRTAPRSRPRRRA